MSVGRPSGGPVVRERRDYRGWPEPVKTGNRRDRSGAVAFSLSPAYNDGEEDLKDQEIADALGVSLASAKKRIERALKRLGASLGERREP